MANMIPCPYGTHRVLDSKRTLPQAARRLDNSMPMQANEMLIAVDTLNVDSASFTQIREACGGNKDKMAEMILQIVQERGKLQNPVTGSGGMLLGTVKDIGPDFPGEAQRGDRIATLVSLSLTPLAIKRIKEIHLDSDQVDIEGEAILFASGIWSPIPDDMDQKVALAALDVAGAPAQVNRLVKPGDAVMILGASGKSGVLCATQAKRNAGEKGRVIGVCYDPVETEELRALGVCDAIVFADATDPLDVYRKVLEQNDGKQVDLSINVVNVQGTEMATILPTRDEGIVYFFSMATSFSKAALGAEGVASGATMIIGNGYTKGHAQLTLDLVKNTPALYQLFKKRYGGGETHAHHQ